MFLSYKVEKWSLFVNTYPQMCIRGKWQSPNLKNWTGLESEMWSPFFRWPGLGRSLDSVISRGYSQPLPYCWSVIHKAETPFTCLLSISCIWTLLDQNQRFAGWSSVGFCQNGWYVYYMHMCVCECTYIYIYINAKLKTNKAKTPQPHSTLHSPLSPSHHTLMLLGRT